MATTYASISEAADRFDVNRDFVYDIAKEMNLAGGCAFKAGGEWRIDPDDMERFLMERTRQQLTSRPTLRRDLSEPSPKIVSPQKIEKSW